MPTMHGPEFHDRHPRAHLIVAEYDRDHVLPKDAPTRLALLMKLAAALGTTSDYTGIDKADDAEVLMAFETDDDAKRFASAILARRTTGDAGWATKATFVYDRKAYNTIRKALA